jgi:hypothetical protein
MKTLDWSVETKRRRMCNTYILLSLSTESVNQWVWDLKISQWKICRASRLEYRDLGPKLRNQYESSKTLTTPCQRSSFHTKKESINFMLGKTANLSQRARI